MPIRKRSAVGIHDNMILDRLHGSINRYIICRHGLSVEGELFRQAFILIPVHKVRMIFNIYRRRHYVCNTCFVKNRITFINKLCPIRGDRPILNFKTLPCITNSDAIFCINVRQIIDWCPSPPRITVFLTVMRCGESCAVFIRNKALLCSTSIRDVIGIRRPASISMLFIEFDRLKLLPDSTLRRKRIQIHC